MVDREVKRKIPFSNILILAEKVINNQALMRIPLKYCKTSGKKVILSKRTYRCDNDHQKIIKLKMI